MSKAAKMHDEGAIGGTTVAAERKLIEICDSLGNTIAGFSTYMPRRKEYLIGRESNNDLIIDNFYVSKRHGRLFYEGQWHYQDYSQNGSFLTAERKSFPLILGRSYPLLGDGLAGRVNSIYLGSMEPVRKSKEKDPDHGALLFVKISG